MRLGGRCSDGDRLALVAELDLALAVLLSGSGGLGALAGLALSGRGESGDGEHQRECEDGSEDDADSLTAVHGGDPPWRLVRALRLDRPDGRSSVSLA